MDKSTDSARQNMSERVLNDINFCLLDSPLFFKHNMVLSILSKCGVDGAVPFTFFSEARC